MFGFQIDILVWSVHLSFFNIILSFFLYISFSIIYIFHFVCFFPNVLFLSFSPTLKLFPSVFLCVLFLYISLTISLPLSAVYWDKHVGALFELFFIISASKSCKSIQKHGKLICWPAFEVHSTQMLFKIYNICLSFYSVSFYSRYSFLSFLLWTTPMTHIEISISVTVNIFVHKCHKNYWLDHWQAMDKKGTWGQSYITAKSNMFSNY